MIEYLCESCKQSGNTPNCEHCGSADTSKEVW